MPNYRRARISGGTYFFTLCSCGRRPIFTSRPVRVAIAHAMAHVRRKRPFQVNAWVLLPDHLHCIWTLPPDDSDFSSRWSMIKRIVTQHCNVLPGRAERTVGSRREGGIWQRRFWEHLIRCDEDYRAHVDYIHWNPVKHGYAACAMSWEFSSFAKYVSRGIYPPDWGTSEGEFDTGEFGE